MSQCLSWISSALGGVLGWFDQLFTADYLAAYFAALAILLAVRFLLMPIIGMASSDRARRILHRKDD